LIDFGLSFGRDDDRSIHLSKRAQRRARTTSHGSARSGWRSRSFSPAIEFRLLLLREHKGLAGPNRTRRMNAVPKLFRNIKPLRRSELHQFIEQDSFVHLVTFGSARR
jgi:hypothetical protein